MDFARGFFLSLAALFSFDLTLSFLLWIFGILFFSFLSAVHSIAIGSSLLFFLKIAAGILAVLPAFWAGKKEESAEILYLVFILGGLGVCAVGYLFWSVAGRQFPYMSSTFYQSDVFGGYLLMLIPLPAALAVFSEGKLRRIIYLLTTSFFVLTLFLTYSRGAILIFLLMALIWGILIFHKKPAALKYGAALLLSLFLFTTSYILIAKKGSLLLTFRNKMITAASWEKNGGARLSFWKGAVEIFAGHPWLGSGPDTFGRLFPLHQEKVYWYSRFPHNFYLQMLSDEGIFVFALETGLILWILFYGFRSIRREQADFSPLPLGLFVGFLAGALHTLVDVDSNFLAWQLLFWGEGGLLLALSGWRGPASTRGQKAWAACTLLLLLGFQGSAAIAAAFDRRSSDLQAKGEFNKGLLEETKAIRFFPLESEYWNRKSKLDVALYSATGRKLWLVEAGKNLDQALILDPVKPVYLGELAGIKSVSPDGKREAIRILKQALSFDPLNYPEHYVRLADLEAGIGEFSEAKATYTKVIALYPRDQISQLLFFRQEEFENTVGMAHLGLAELALREKDLKEASREVVLALQWNRTDPKIGFDAGLIALYNRNWSDAREEFSKAVYDPALAPGAWEWLSLSELRLKEKADALAAIRNAARLRKEEKLPPDPFLEDLARKIYSLQGSH